MKTLPILLAAVACLAAAPLRAEASDCLPRPTAPGHFLNTPVSWANDSGPILRGFLELQGATVLHGIDLSHNNANVPYAHIKACGASFAIVKMDKGFAAHRQALLVQGFSVIPYNFLSVANQNGDHDYKGHPADFSMPDGRKLDDAHLKQLLDTASSLGRWKAGLFVDRYMSTLAPADRVGDLGGIHGNIIVVDVEEAFQKPSTETQRLAYARFYARMLSSWVKAVREKIPNAIFIFYTFPDIYTSYLQFALPDDNAVIHGMPVWLARTRGDGSDLDLNSDRNLQRICLSASGGNKCILHQYSHRAIFNGAPLGRAVPAHIDVDRLFRISAVADGDGVQYVRAQ